jgi:hypothetical protein
MGWIGAGDELRLVFVNHRFLDKKQIQEWYLAEPETGKFAPVEKSPLPSDEQTRQLSPDGKLVASIVGKDKLTIKEELSGHTRTFLFHEEDKRFVHEVCFGWVSPPYLLLELNRFAFLDVRTMKMSYPLRKSHEFVLEGFSSNFKWVLWRKPDDGLYVSPVVVPLSDP